MVKMRVGFHISISGGFDKAVVRAVEQGCNTFQIFTRNPRAWKPKELTQKETKAFNEKVNSFNVKPVFGHMPYLANLASPRRDIYSKSVWTLKNELERSRKLEIPYLVTHLGSHLGTGIQEGFRRIIKAVDEAFKVAGEGVTLLLENTAGTKNSMGSSFEDIQRIIQSLANPECIGICFEEKTIRNIDDAIGFDNLKLIHLNDSIGDLNSGIDRHEHIGMGKIGEEGFRNVLRSRFSRLPLIMETPKDMRRSNVENLRKVKELAGEL
jgi:deoxyribonuclease-4